MASRVDPDPSAPAESPSPRGRRFRWRPLAALVLGLVLAFVLPGWLVADSAEPANGVLLPDSIAGYAQFTSAAEADPAGTTVLLYSSGNWELGGTYQTLALAVNGRSYRRIDTADVRTSGTAFRETFLAPDGNTVLVTDRSYDGRPLTTVDLRTGATRDIPVPARSGVLALAWAPDLHTVALAIESRPGPDVGLPYAQAGTLTLLDLRTGTLTPVPGLGGSVVAAAWSPDGRLRRSRHHADRSTPGTPSLRVSCSPPCRWPTDTPRHSPSSRALTPASIF
jgi:hypothetical protein